jgi:transposase
MDKFNLIVGIDVAKNSLAVCFSQNDVVKDAFTVENNAKGLKTLLDRILTFETDPAKVLIGCENTGKYISKLAMVLQSEGFLLWVLHPLIIASYRVDMQRAKTDETDAEKITNFCSAHQHKASNYNRPDQISSELRELFGLRKMLIKERTMNINYLKSNQDSAVENMMITAVMNKLIAYLNEQITLVEQSIKQLIFANEKLKKQYQLLASIPGIGPVIAQHFLMVTYGFTRFDNWRKFSSFIGCAPFPYRSGTSVRRRTRTSSQGYRSFKADLHQGAMSMIRPGQFFHLYYQTLIAQNVHHLKVINNIMNMLIKIAFQIIRSESEFNPQIFLQNKKSWTQNLVTS